MIITSGSLQRVCERKTTHLWWGFPFTSLCQTVWAVLSLHQRFQTQNYQPHPHTLHSEKSWEFLWALAWWSSCCTSRQRLLKGVMSRLTTNSSWTSRPKSCWVMAADKTEREGVGVWIKCNTSARMLHYCMLQMRTNQRLKKASLSTLGSHPTRWKGFIVFDIKSDPVKV